MTNKIFYRVVIYTVSGVYDLPMVDLDKYRDQMKPVQYGNPCLQIINEELSVLSITWDRVSSIMAIPNDGAGEAEMILWRSAA